MANYQRASDRFAVVGGDLKNYGMRVNHLSLSRENSINYEKSINKK
jgi:hypothetical protein